MEEPRAPLRRQSPAQPAEGKAGAARIEPYLSTTADKGQRRRALLVEAEPETLQLCRDVLEKSGFVVDVVDSGIAAVIAARQARPDLILVDLQLRDVPGREAIGWLRSNPALRSTPIIVLTTNTDADGELATIRPGASLRKPVSPAAIQRMIHQVLR
jgi:DNA-binding response OmpR family regulator